MARAAAISTGAAQIVKTFFPNLVTFSYSPEVKSKLALKAYDVISNGRLEYDAGMHDLTQSIMAIKKTMTTSQRQITDTAGAYR